MPTMREAQQLRRLGAGMILVGLDPGLTGGGLVVRHGNTFETLFHQAWAANSTNGLIICANIAKIVASRFPDSWLIVERPFIKQFVKIAQSEKALRQIQAKGWVEVPTSVGAVALSIAKCIGIFLAYWPAQFMELGPSEWRSEAGVSAPTKAADLARALELLPGKDPLRQTLEATGNDHLADAFCLTVAGEGLLRFSRGIR